MDKLNQILKELNPQQKQAVEHFNGPAVVLAGAGSGKTRVLITRVFNLVYKHKIDPSAIMLVTFTNKAAKEMTERLGDVKVGFVGTFHSFCVRVLRIWGAKIGLNKNFVIYDDDDQVALMKKILKSLNLGKTFSPRYYLSIISMAKNNNFELEDYIYQNYSSFIADKIYQVCQAYEKEKQANSAVDFDDLLLLAVKLLSTNRQVLESLQKRFSYVLIDEFQDTNTVQYELARLICFSHNNLFVVGDFSQSIYSWRGAQIQNLKKIQKDFPNTKEYRLEINYRSTQQILNYAYEVISQNTTHPVLHLKTEFKGDYDVEIKGFADEEQEAVFVAETIMQLNELNNFNDFAVLFRTNAQSRYLEETLIRYNLPYRLTGGVRFYERKEIKDLLSYLRLVVNPNDSVSLDRALKIGKRRYRGFEKLLEEKDLISLPTPEIIAKVLQATSYLDLYNDKVEEDLSRLENIKEFRSISYEYPNINEFLEHIALVESEYFEGEKKTANGVQLMTLHQAKGLEFSVVFIVGVEDGLLPHSKSIDDQNALEEERRLFYVGITRAMERLFITYAQTRKIYGRRNFSVVSRFLI